MARKNLLAALTGPELPAGNSAPPKPERAGEGGARFGIAGFGTAGTRGAIGAVTRSIEQLKAQSVVELAPELIEASPIADRLPGDPASLAALTASIREHGQQVPILVRPHPERDGRFQIAYGRRRLKAVLELARPVRAIVKSLTDAELVVAQGQENSARTDLSFIEKAAFAAKLEEAGFDRETIMAALSVDKTGLSRLISAAVKIPSDIIEAIGPAPKAGRDRWIALAERLATPPALARVRSAVAINAFGGKSSDDRFVAVFEAAAPKAKRQGRGPRGRIVEADDGTQVASVTDDARRLTLAINKKSAGGFGAYLVEQLPALFAAYRGGEGAPAPQRKGAT